MTMVAEMHKFVFVIIASCMLVLCGCKTIPLQTLPTLQDEGEVFVYCQPFPDEAVSLRFGLSAIAAVRDDGREFPLALLVSELGGSDMTRQRLIAAGRLPAGSYTGFLVSTKSATLTTEQGKADLRVPETPQKREFPFTVEKKTALVIAFTFQYAESLQEGISFNPRFLVTIPQRPLVELTGYVSNTGDDTVTLFDKIKMQAAGAIATGNGPRGTVLNSRTKKAYVALSGDDAIDVIDMSVGTLFDRIMLNRGDDPQELALTPDGQSLLAVNAGSDTVSIIDTASRVERARITVGRNPRSVLIDGAGRKAFIFNRLSNSISVIDLAYQKVMGTIATGPEPLRGQFNRTGDRLYVIHAQYPYLYVIDPVSFSLLQQQFMGAGITSLKVDTRTDLLYLVKKNDTAITLYNPVTFAPVGYLPVRGAAEYMTIDNETNNLYAVIPERKVLVIINLILNKPVAEIDVSQRPSWVTVMGER